MLWQFLEGAGCLALELSKRLGLVNAVARRNARTMHSMFGLSLSRAECPMGNWLGIIPKVQSVLVVWFSPIGIHATEGAAFGDEAPVARAKSASIAQ